MLKIIVPGGELYDEKNQKFITSKPTELVLEHSLVSLAKWESKWKIPFLSKTSKTEEQAIDYIRCMTITQNVDDSVYYALTNENKMAIKEYIDDEMTATKINDKGRKRNNQLITAEIIYYWMTALNIPFECQKWHLNRLLTLVQVCSIEQEPKKKMSTKSIMSQNAKLNAARRKANNSRG